MDMNNLQRPWTYMKIFNHKFKLKIFIRFAEEGLNNQT